MLVENDDFIEKVADAVAARLSQIQPPARESLTFDEACAWLGIKRRGLEDLLRYKQPFPVYRCGRLLRFRIEDLRNYVLGQARVTPCR